MNNRVVIILISILLVASLTAVMGQETHEESPLSKEPLWMKDYGGNKSVLAVPTHEGEFIVFREEGVDLLDRDGKVIWSNTDLENISYSPKFKNDKIYVTSYESQEHYLLCLNKDDGSIEWKVKITTRSYNIMISDQGEVFIPAVLGGNITKISPEGEIVWDKKFGIGSYIYNSKIIDDELYVISNYPESNLTCISRSGEIRWKFNVENEHLEGIHYDEDTETVFASTNNTIYRLNSEGDGEKVYQAENKKQITMPKYTQDRFFFTVQNESHNYLSIRSISRDGELLWNASVGELKGNNAMAMITIGENERVYCQYRNLSDTERGFMINVYRIEAYTLDGELVWDHEYDDGKARYYHFITENGIIITSTYDEVYAYQGKALGDGYLPWLIMSLGIAGVMGVLGMIYYFYRQVLKEEKSPF